MSAMSLGLKNRMSVSATVVSNEFIDRYMAAANGEYVKVFLYLLRHEGEEITVSAVADALNHTESDVKRALSYWKEAGVLSGVSEHEEAGRAQAAGREALGITGETRAAGREALGAATEGLKTAGRDALEITGEMRAAGREPLTINGETAATAQAEEVSRTLPEPGDSYERLSRLSEDEEFSALLYAVQQYLGKTFTQIECEKFAFFYDGLNMSGDLLEYLAEYCANGGHSSIRYIEKVAINWYQLGIKTREDARNYVSKYSKDMSAVMKAFGLTNRNPATAEQEYMKRWFKEFGFDSALVTEACSRTIKATGSASFPYADKILSGWKESGVRVLRDVEELDKKRQTGRPKSQPRENVKKSAGTNRFKNFEERSYNYEDYVWEGMRKRQKEGGTGNGAQ